MFCDDYTQRRALEFPRRARFSDERAGPRSCDRHRRSCDCLIPRRSSLARGESAGGNNDLAEGVRHSRQTATPTFGDEDRSSDASSREMREGSRLPPPPPLPPPQSRAACSALRPSRLAAKCSPALWRPSAPPGPSFTLWRERSSPEGRGCENPLGRSHSASRGGTAPLCGARVSVVVKLMDLDPQGRWFDPWCGQDKICTAVGPLSKALNPTLLQGVCLLLSLINCKSLWIKASAK